jgi:hypothetical protein
MFFGYFLHAITGKSELQDQIARNVIFSWKFILIGDSYIPDTAVANVSQKHNFAYLALTISRCPSLALETPPIALEAWTLLSAI